MDSFLIPMPSRRSTRLVAALVALAMLTAACTSSSSADVTDDTEAPAPSTTAEAPEITLPSSTTTTDEGLAPVTQPARKVVSDGGAIVEITETRRLTLARTPALEIGQDPIESDRFGRFDLGAGRSVIAVVHHADDTESILFTTNDTSIGIDGGIDAIAADDGTWLAWIAPSGDEVHIGDLTGAVTETLELPGPAVDMAETPTGFAVLTVTASSSSVTQVAVEARRSTRSEEIAMSAGTTTITSVVDGQIAGVAIRGDRSVIEVLAADGTAVGSSVIDGHVHELDFSSDGSVAIAVNDNGEQLWWSDGRSELIDDEPVRAAQW